MNVSLQFSEMWDSSGQVGWNILSSGHGFTIGNIDDWAGVISTASNLSSEIFQEITHILGIDFSPYSTKSVLQRFAFLFDTDSVLYIKSV